MSNLSRRHSGLLLGFLFLIALATVLIHLHLLRAPQQLAELTPFLQLMLAGTIVAVLRGEVGLDTFGMFGPIIIAFSLLPVGPIWGLIVFFNIFLITLVTRLVIGPLNIGTPHRIGTLVIVVGLMAITIELVAADVIPQRIGATPVLFPALITAWYADQFGRTVEEQGWQLPSAQLLWTVLVIAIAYLIISFDPLVRFLVAVPETWVLLLGINLYIGVTSDTKLREYFRFRQHPTAPSVTDLRARLETIPRHWWARAANLLGGERAVPLPPDQEFLTMNVRNREFVREYNPDYLFPTLDKTWVKRTFHGLGIPTPDTYLILDDKAQLADVASVLADVDDFVVKPNNSHGGEGVLVISGRTEDGRFQARDRTLSEDDLLAYIRSVLEGKFAPGARPSKVIIEERVVTTPLFRELCGSGVPDIRVVVFRGYPVMAMARLPTAASGGVANLHQGAIGVGLAIDSGRAVAAYNQSTDEWLDHHPDTGEPIERLEFPDWPGLLSIATRAASAQKLGFAGVDIVFDEAKGPLVLEVNKRPGLGIQNANRAGLLKRLRLVERLPTTAEFEPPSEKIDRAMAWARTDWSPPAEPATDAGRSAPGPTGGDH